MVFDRFVVDSSVFVAFYWALDSQHEDALRVMEGLAGNTLIVHPYVIQEVTTVLTHRLGLPVAKKFLNDISTSKDVRLAYADIKADIDAFTILNARISFTDIALIALAKKEDAKLVTFDRQMLSLYAKK